MRVPHLLGLYTGPLGGLDLRVGVIGDGTPSLRGRRADWGGSSHGPLVRCTASSGTRAQIHPFGGRVPTRSSPRVCRSRSSVASTPGRSTWSPRAPPTTRPERANEQTQDTGGWWRARVQLAVREMVPIPVRPIQVEGRLERICIAEILLSGVVRFRLRRRTSLSGNKCRAMFLKRCSISHRRLL
jgi:hypothetical protein